MSAEDLTAWQQQASSARNASVANWIRQTLNREVQARQSAAEAGQPAPDHDPGPAVPRVTTLANGFRLVVHEAPGLPNIGYCLAVDGGSREELRGEYGFTSLLGRLLLHSSGINFHGLEEAGGDLSVATSRDQTLFTGFSPASAIRRAMDRLLRTVNPPDFSHALFETERQTSLRQLELRRHRAEDLLADTLAEGCWQEHPLSRAPHGEVNSLLAATPESLRLFFERQFTASRMVLSLYGDFSRWNPVEEATTLFAAIPPGHPPALPAPARFRSFVDVLDWQGRYANLAIAIAAPALNSSYRWAFDLWEPLLVHGMDSLLWQKLWTRRSEVLRLRCHYDAYREGGMLRIHTTSDESAVAWILDRVLAGLEEVLLGPENIPDGRLQYAQSVRIRQLPRPGDVQEHANYLSTGHLASSDFESVADARSAIYAVDSRVLHRGLRDLVRPQIGNLSVAIASPVPANADSWRKLVQERVQKRLATGGGLAYPNAPWTM